MQVAQALLHTLLQFCCSSAPPTKRRMRNTQQKGKWKRAPLPVGVSHGRGGGRRVMREMCSNALLGPENTGAHQYQVHHENAGCSVFFRSARATSQPAASYKNKQKMQEEPVRTLDARTMMQLTCRGDAGGGGKVICVRVRISWLSLR